MKMEMKKITLEELEKKACADPHGIWELFVWDSYMNALVKINNVYPDEGRLSTKCGREICWYDTDKVDMYIIEGFEA